MVTGAVLTVDVGLVSALRPPTLRVTIGSFDAGYVGCIGPFICIMGCDRDNTYNSLCAIMSG